MTQPCWNCGVPAAFVDRPPLSPTQGTARDLTRLRTGNDAPLDSEIPSICKIIADGEERMARLDNQVRDLEATLADLAQRRDDAVKHLREHRAILHPLRRAPPELICEIFAMTLDTADDSTHIKGTGYKPPWYLGHICRSWRLWALACPRLWTHITIPSSPAHSTDRPVLETLLLWSSNALLNVCWTVEDVDYWRSVDRNLADLALVHCRRWATLRLDMSMIPPDDALSWLHPVKGCLPSLRRLDVLSDGKIADIRDVFSIAPSLCEVLLTDWELAYYSPDIQIPWDQITHYRGVFAEEAQLNVLRAAPKLVQCAISFETPALPPDESASITLSLLRRLYIEKPVHLRHLTTPSLEELYCKQVDQEDPQVLLLPFVHRSHCRLQKLVLMSCLISPELITALRGLPNLAYLLIEAIYGAASQNIDIFGEMTIAGTAHDLFPNLSCLVFGIHGRDLADCRGRFLHMAQSRFRPSPQGTRLTYLRVFASQPNDDIPAATKELRDEGFDADMLSEKEFALLMGKGFFP
ncbi:hypothetical protein DFH06DRAFT_1150321 [Mycena polygramma]|nr:hypothetical protein DFH06DRAFT_1150321 [Mycena polygramma]